MAEILQFRPPVEIEIIPLDNTDIDCACVCGCATFYICADLVAECTECGDCIDIETFIKTHKEGE